MRLDRHDRLAKAFKRLHHSRNEFWQNESGKYPNYRLDIKPMAYHVLADNLLQHPNHELTCYDIKEAAKYRSIAIYVHWFALLNILKTYYIDSEKGFFTESILGFPEIQLLRKQKQRRDNIFKDNLVVPFTVSVSYQNHPKEWLRKFVDMSWILSFDEQDLEVPKCFDIKEQISEFEKEGAWKRAINWSRQIKNKSSILFKNRDLFVEDLWEKFIRLDESIFSKPKSQSQSKISKPSEAPKPNSKVYPFKPAGKKTIGESLIQANLFINATSSLHYRKIAKQWLHCLIRALFKGTNLTLRQESVVLGNFGICHPAYSEDSFCPLILELSAYPIDYQRMVKYLDVLYTDFLANPKKNEQSGTLLLIILICLQASHRKERVFSAEDILNLTTANWHGLKQSFEIHNDTLPISHGLSAVVEAFIPKTKKQNRKLFAISRSLINRLLRGINTKLGYDWDNDPVTLQTFIARPTHDWIGNRSRPILWNIASKTRHYQLRVMSKLIQENTLPRKYAFKIKENTPNIRVLAFLKSSNFSPQKTNFKAFRMNQLS